jgi:hypothetical protein
VFDLAFGQVNVFQHVTTSGTLSYIFKTG